MFFQYINNCAPTIIFTVTDYILQYTEHPNLLMETMKLLAFFAVFVLFVDLSLQLPELKNCEGVEIPTGIANSCGSFTCNGTTISGVGCPVSFCLPGHYTGFNAGNDSAVYPGCCSSPCCDNV